MGMEFKHILFTSDLTAGARRVFDHAVSLADKYGAKITIIHVVEEVPASVKMALGSILDKGRLDELRAKYKDEALTTLVGKSRERTIIREGLEMFCQDAMADQPECRVEPPDNVIVKEGNVIDEIIDQVKTYGCDLIVMGAHRMGRIEEVVVGSVVRGVLNKADVPVFVVPMRRED